MDQLPYGRGAAFGSRARFLLATLCAFVLLTQPAWADTTLDTSTTLSTNAALPTTVAIGANSFTIRVSGTTGNIPSGKNGIVSVVNSYSMSTSGVITAGASTTTVTLPKINYNSCPATGSIPLGCPANPFLVSATLTVAAGTSNNTSGTLTVVASPDADAGVTADPSPALGRVRVTVPNAAPTVGSITGASTETEGSSSAYSVVAVDPDGDTLSYAWSVTTGNATVPATNSPSATVSFGDGPSNVTLQVIVNDGQGHPVTRTIAITVDNVAPTAIFNAPPSVGEGSAIALSLTSSADVSSADTAAGFTYAFDCGSGYGPFSATNTASCPTDDNGSRTVKGSIRDKDGGATEYSATVTINNVAPTATFNASSPVDEGSDIMLSLTAPSDSSSIDAAAGFAYAFDCGGGYGAFSATNTASCATDDNGSRSVKAKVRDKDGGATEYSATVSIDNVAPTATFNAPSSVNEGSAIGLSLTDPADVSTVDAAAGFTHSFDCDDGAGPTGFAAANSTSCATDDNGSRTVGGSIRDKDGDANSYTASVTIDNVAPSATFETPGTVDEGAPIFLALTSPFDPSGADTAAGFEYAFDCGDGYGPFSATNTASCATDDNGTRTVKGSIRDKDGGTTEYSASVVVDNVAPTATFTSPSAVDEGTDIAVSLTSPSDPSSVDTAAGFEYAFDCGDGYGPFGASATTSCATDDNGNRIVKGSIRDKDGGTTEYTSTVAIDNVAPTATFDAPPSVNEGSAIALSLTDPADVSSADTSAGFTYAFDCGSGYGPFAATNTANCPTTDNGIRTVKGQIRDKDGGISEYSAPVVADNVAPTATFTIPSAVDEGTDIAVSLTDPSDPSSVDTAAGFEYAFDCGSGYGPFSASATTSCATDDNGNHTVKGKIRDKDGGATEYSATVSIDNVAPVATFNAPPSVGEGSAIALSLTGPADVSSADTAAGFTYAFDCGSGYGPFSATSTASCPTDDNGSRTVKGSIRDKDNGTTEYTATVTINNAAPTATFDASSPVDEGTDISLSLTAPSDPSSVDIAAGLEYAFDCGGGYGLFGPVSAANCATNDNGTRTVKAKIRDKDGGATEYSATVSIDNVAPTATFNAPSSVNEGSAIALSLTDPADVSTVDTAAGFTHSFDCDNGAGPSGFAAANSTSCATDDNGTRTVGGSIRDKDGDASSYTASVTVDNVAPSATFNAPPSVNEGSGIALSLTGPADVSSADTSAGFTYAFDCGNGAGLGAFGAAASTSCPTSDNGTRTVKGSIRDKDGGTTEYSASVVVDNVAPTATFTSPSTVNEGTGIAVSMTSPSDPSSVDTAAAFAYAFDCGSGYGPFSASATSSCATNDNGARTVKAKIRDKDGGATEYSATVSIDNVAPTATFTAPPSVGEGSAIALSLTGPADVSSADAAAGFTYAFDCGSGYGPFAATITANCPTTDNGTRTVKGQIRDKDGGIGEYTASVEIDNVAPTAHGFLITRQPGPACASNTVSVGFTVSDPADNSADPITGIVTWGDGNTTSITGRTVSVSHAYAPGVYSLTVSIDDGDGGTAGAGGPGNVSLLYSTSGIQQPIDATGTSTFKLGSTIPTKVGVNNCSGVGVSNQALEVRLTKLLPTTAAVNEVVSSSAADTGNLMRSQADGQYIFNLSTKRSQFNAGNDLTAGRYRLQIVGATIATVTVEFSVRA